MMTPQEVANCTFAKAVMGGYNMASVDDFLDKLTEDYAALYKENAALKSKLKVVADKLEEYREVDEAIAAEERRLAAGQQGLRDFIQSVQSVCQGQLDLLQRLPELPPEPQPEAEPQPEEAEEIARKYLKMVDLEGFAKSYPKELSGGMKQRVAIARAYAVNPKVLLMDEPFGALDAQTRTQLQQELLNTWEKEQKTCFFITHDVEEAIILAQRVVVMCARPGRVKDIVDIDIPYPRDQETKMSPRFLELKNHIWSQVYQEYLSVRK